MVQIARPILPQTLEAFLEWEPADGFKYEWNNGEIIQFIGMRKKQYYIYDVLNTLFIEKGYHKTGTFIAEPDVMLTTTQMRRPDIAYFTKEQIQRSRNGEDVIPAFVVEVLSETDLAYRVEEKIAEYFDAGIQVVWTIYPTLAVVYVYTSRKQATICLENDVCSATPVLPDFSLTINTLFAGPEA